MSVNAAFTCLNSVRLEVWPVAGWSARLLFSVGGVSAGVRKKSPEKNNVNG